MGGIRVRQTKKANEDEISRSQVVKEKAKVVYQTGQGKIRENIWLELLTVIIVSLVAAALVFVLVSHSINATDLGTREYTSYSEGRSAVQEQMLYAIQRINGIDSEAISITIDLDELEMVMDNSKEEALDYIRYEIIERYQAFGEGISQMREEEIYNILLRLRQDGQWMRTDVTEAIKTYLAECGIDGEFKISQRVQEIINNIKHNTYYVRDIQCYLVDSTGKVLYDNGTVSAINLITAIQRSNYDEIGRAHV